MGITNGKNVVQTENDLKKFSPKNWNKPTNNLHGREFCKAGFPNKNKREKKPIKTKKQIIL